MVGAALAVLGGPGASAAMDDRMHGATDTSDTSIAIQFVAYTPPKIDVLTGDTVRWSNGSVRAHTVNAHDGSWASPRLVIDDSYSHQFDTPGTVPYYCNLHPVMRGEVDVHNVLLTAPSEPGAPGRPYVFNGRSALPAGSAVSLEADTGSGFQPAANATVEADGTFTTEVLPTTSATYRAVVGGESSPAVQLLVLDRKVAVTAGGHGRAGAGDRAGCAGVARSARRPAAAHAPALRLVAGGPREARPWLDGALLAAPAPPLPGARGPHPARRRHRAGRQPHAAPRSALSGRRILRTGGMCTFGRLPWEET